MVGVEGCQKRVDTYLHGYKEEYNNGERVTIGQQTISHGTNTTSRPKRKQDQV